LEYNDRRNLPKCGRLYYGWGITPTTQSSCPKCGVGLLITEDGKRLVKDIPLFTDEEYKFKSLMEFCLDTARTKNTNVKE